MPRISDVVLTVLDGIGAVREYEVHEDTVYVVGSVDGYEDVLRGLSCDIETTETGVTIHQGSATSGTEYQRDLSEI